MLINIHTHSIATSTDSEIVLPNCIVSKDYLYEQECSAGIHPWYIDFNFAPQWDALLKYVEKPRVLAIGECGLDKMCTTDWTRQVEVFEKQIELANLVKKPLIIHCVRAYHEVFVSLLRKEVKVPVIFHGYDRNPSLANQLIKNNNYFISFGAAILKGKLDDVITQIPLERVFLETDEKPVKISDIYTYFCSVKKLPDRIVQDQILDNFNRVFK